MYGKRDAVEQQRRNPQKYADETLRYHMRHLSYLRDDICGNLTENLDDEVIKLRRNGKLNGFSI